MAASIIRAFFVYHPGEQRAAGHRRGAQLHIALLGGARSGVAPSSVGL